MTVTVSVDATWRLSRVEFNTRHDVPWDVHGRGEVLLQEATGSPSIPAVFGGGTSRGGDEKKTYGTMPSNPVSRLINDVLDESVDVGGTTISFATIMQALPLFFERWRVEDVENPVPAMVLPQAAPETAMPQAPTGVPQAGPEAPVNKD